MIAPVVVHMLLAGAGFFLAIRQHRWMLASFLGLIVALTVGGLLFLAFSPGKPYRIFYLIAELLYGLALLLLCAHTVSQVSNSRWTGAYLIFWISLLAGGITLQFHDFKTLSVFNVTAGVYFCIIAMLFALLRDDLPWTRETLFTAFGILLLAFGAVGPQIGPLRDSAALEQASQWIDLPGLLLLVAAAYISQTQLFSFRDGSGLKP